MPTELLRGNDGDEHVRAEADVLAERKRRILGVMGYSGDWLLSR